MSTADKPQSVDITYHYPPELLELLVDTIPRLVRSKPSVLLFFKGAGVSRDLLASVQKILDDRPDTNKFHLARKVLEGLNDLGEPALGQRREVIRRVTEFDDFTRPYPNEQLKARGLVAQVQHLVNVKDSFTRMHQEAQTARKEHTTRRENEAAALRAKRDEREGIARDLGKLFSEHNPQLRGKLLEVVLNRLFAAFDILVREAFELRNEDGVCLEQVDGVIELDNQIYFVEMKWTAGPIGRPELSQHLVRVFGRHCARALFISAASYTRPAIELAKDSLSQTVISLITLQEIVLLLERQFDLREMLRRKIHAAVIEKNPWHEATGA